MRQPALFYDLSRPPRGPCVSAGQDIISAELDVASARDQQRHKCPPGLSSDWGPPFQKADDAAAESALQMITAPKPKAMPLKEQDPDIVTTRTTQTATASPGTGTTDPVLVLLHGISGFSEYWSQVIDSLSGRRPVLRPDYVPRRRAATVAEAASHVLRSADTNSRGLLDLVGYSLGAGVAAYIAAQHPERVRSLALISGFAHGGDTRMKLQFELWLELARKDREALTKLLLLAGFSRDFLSNFDDRMTAALVDGFVTASDWESITRSIALCLALDIRENAQTITSPAIVIAASHDQIVPASYSQELADLIPGAQRARIVSGHLSFLEQPTALAETVLTFLDSIAAPGGV